MLLLHGKSDAVREKNIQELIQSGYEPRQAVAIAYSQQNKSSKDSGTNREYDINGWAEIKHNPISKEGVFQYLGSQISDDLNPTQIYKVYRSAKELSHPETIKSFKLLPWTDEHAMLGEGMLAAEEKGIDGVIGEDVYFDESDGYLKANLKIFSEKLANLIDEGKRELSIGYRCVYEFNPGIFNNESYDFIQKNIRGNHIALVEEGRSGHDVSVLDSFKITLDSKDIKMPNKKSKNVKDEREEILEEKKEEIVKDEKMDIEECREMMKKLAERLEELSKTKDEHIDKEEYFEQKDEKMDIEEAREMLKKLAERLEELSKTKDEYVDKEEYFEQEDEEVDRAKFVNKANITEDEAMKKVLKEISLRDDLANKLAKHIGVFDHKDKTLTEVAQYGLKKLGLDCKKGHEESVLNGYLAGARVSPLSANVQDSAPKSTQIEEYLKGSK